MAKLQDVTENDFQSEVLGAEKPVLVTSGRRGAARARSSRQSSRSSRREYSTDMGFTKLNVDEAPNIALKYQVMSIPTLMVFQGGEPVAQVVARCRRRRSRIASSPR